MERYVALKILPEHYARDPEFVRRFNREARTIARLEHKNILPVYDFGEEGGVTYLAMRYLESGTLKDVLEIGRLMLPDAVHILQQVCSALDYAHREGVVHRDVKPSNVMIDDEGEAYLTDFGIAKVLESSEQLTATGGVLGTPAYMAPEQVMGQPVDARADIYALGIILYEMALGRVPYDADTPMAVALAHVREPLPLPRELDPNLPEPIEVVILKALAKEPGDRYPTASQLSAALDKAVSTADIDESGSTLRTLATHARLSRADEIATYDVAAGPLRPTTKPARLRRWLLPAGGLALVAIIVSVFMLLGTVEADRSADGDETVAAQVELPVRFTQTAEAKLTMVAAMTVSATGTQPFVSIDTMPSSTLTSSATPISTLTPTPALLQLTDGVGNNYSPSFSPDGIKIVFISTRDGNPEIYIMNTDRSEQTRLTNTPNIYEDLPSFSPDGSLILFAGNDGHDEDLYVMNVDGSQTQNISNSPNSNDGRPKFVPSMFVSLKVIFDSDRSGDWEIYSAPFEINRLGSVTLVTSRPTYNDRLPSYVSSTGQILFRSELIGSGDSRIYLVGEDGSNPTQLSSEYNDWYPIVSNDGNWIVFVSNREGNEELYAIMKSDGSDIVRLTENPAQDTTPAISPNNQWLVFASKRDGNSLHLFQIPFPLSSP